MKKTLFAFLLLLCTFAAQAQQFQNPFIYKIGKFCQFGVSVSATQGDIVSASTVVLPKDTVMPLGEFRLDAMLAWFGQEEHTDADLDFMKTITADFQIHDYYGRNVLGLNGQRVDSLLHYELYEDAPGFIEYTDEGYYPKGEVVATEIAGHYDWSWTANNGIEGMSGHVQFNEKPRNSVWGLNDGSSVELREFKTLAIRSKINTGFPYNAAKYLGKAKFTVYSPDSTLICLKEIDLRIRPDSAMNAQLQEDLVCEIDSARHGKYKVILEAPFLDKPQPWVIEVIDPLAGASSKNPIDATYRLAERNFKEAGKGKGWKYSGSVAPTYYTDSTVVSQSVMVVRPAEDCADNSFTLTQSVSKMPQGFYTLSLPVAYQPCAFNKMQYTEEILAVADVNGVSKKAKHIMAGASTGSVTQQGMEFTSLTVPYSDEAFSTRLAQYKQQIVFEVKADSLITLGVHKNHTDSLGEVTVIGAPELMFYGDALPYGKVVFPQDSVFAAGDSLKTTVQLYDGLSGKVPEDNKIQLLIAPLTEQGTVVRDKLLFIQEDEAGKAGDYDVSVALPEADKCPAGTYALMIASLQVNGKYEVNEHFVFQVKGASAIDEVRSAALESAPAYNLSGVRLSNDADAKGIYIQGGKKFMKQTEH